MQKKEHPPHPTISRPAQLQKTQFMLVASMLVYFFGKLPLGSYSAQGSVRVP